MKHIYNIGMLAAIAALSLASCARELDMPSAEDETVPEGYYCEELTLSYPTGETRTAFDETTGRFSWSEGDLIAFHLSDGSYTVAEINPETSKVRLYIQEGLVRDNFAVYPASAAVAEHATVGDMQVKLPDSYDISGNPTTDYVPMPMIAVQDETNHLKFNHTGALLQVTVDIPAGTKTAKVSLGDKALSGTLDVVADGSFYKTNVTDASEVEDGGNTITFTVSDEEAGLEEETHAKLLLPVSTGAYDEIKITYTDGEDDTYEFHKDVNMNFKRSGGKKLSIAFSQFEDAYDYFWIEALEAGSMVQPRLRSDYNGVLSYSFDKKNWNTCPSLKKITLENVGDRVWFRGNGTSFSVQKGKYQILYYSSFNGTGRLACGGKMISLKGKDCSINVTAENLHEVFYGLFYNNTALVDASQLVFCDSENIKYFYADMFYGCTNLVIGPSSFDFTSVGEKGCSEMFMYCSNLIQGPSVLDFSYMGPYACLNMFYECTSLTEAPELPAMNLSEGCYSDMFWQCSSLSSMPYLPAEILTDYCYNGMFERCYNLTDVYDFRITTKLAKGCFGGMFAECTSLVNAPELPATELAEGCYSAMFRNCTSLVNAPELPATELAKSCYLSMFTGCTSLLSAPELNALEVSSEAYKQMFTNCSNLQSFPELPATIVGDYAYDKMFYNCTNAAGSICLPATTLSKYCYNEMFRNCSSLEEIEIMADNIDYDHSCSNMMGYCTSLHSVTVHFTEWPIVNENATAIWMVGSNGPGSFYKPSQLETKYEKNTSNIGGHFIPDEGWTVYNIEDVNVDL